MIQIRAIGLSSFQVRLFVPKPFRIAMCICLLEQPKILFLSRKIRLLVSFIVVSWILFGSFISPVVHNWILVNLRRAILQICRKIVENNPNFRKLKAWILIIGDWLSFLNPRNIYLFWYKSAERIFLWFSQNSTKKNYLAVLADKYILQSGRVLTRKDVPAFEMGYWREFES